MVLSEGIFKDNLTLFLRHGLGHLSLDQVAQGPIQPDLNISSGGESTTSLDSLYKCLTILIIKNPFP